jgi:hypothetical protein
MHVCTHFERWPDRSLTPRSIILPGDNVVEAAVLHPSGHVSGSPKHPLTFENVDVYRSALALSYAPKAEEPKPMAKGRRAAAAAAAQDEEEDLVG